MPVKKRFRKTQGNREAELVADIGTARYTLGLFVDTELIEEKSGYLSDWWDGQNTTVAMSGEGFRATANFNCENVVVNWL